MEPFNHLHVFAHDQEIAQHTLEVNRLTEAINLKLLTLNQRQELVQDPFRANSPRNKFLPPFVTVDCPGEVGYPAMLEVVWKFRRAGWDVSFADHLGIFRIGVGIAQDL